MKFTAEHLDMKISIEIPDESNIATAFDALKTILIGIGFTDAQINNDIIEQYEVAKH